MSLDSVRAFFAEKAPDITVIESSMNSATVALAAEAFGVAPERIAKTLSLRTGDRVVLVVPRAPHGSTTRRPRRYSAASRGCSMPMRWRR
jgi:prolyl-tRNA editing enzyme YbaK/EbsC (Cys-tRNA(Pro) deacylase)